MAKDKFAVGDLVKMSDTARAYKVVGLSEGGDTIFLVKPAFEDRPLSENAFQWRCQDMPEAKVCVQS